MYQKRLKKERKQRQMVQDQLEMELKRRQKVEEALKQSGAPSEILRIVTGKGYQICLSMSDGVFRPLEGRRVA